MKLSLDMIKTDIDYTELYNYESNLAHELKSIGKINFINKYKHVSTNIELNSSEYINLCYLLGLLEYLDSSLIYASSIKLDKYVVDLRDFDIDIDDDLSAVETRYERAIPQLLKRGFIYSEIDSVL